jgi:hypothetical protein
MRSWYFDEAIPFRYDMNSNPVPSGPVHPGYPLGFFPGLPEPPRSAGPGPENDWKAVNNANKAILRANKAVLEANHAIREANTALQQVADDDLAWIDEIADLNQFRTPRGK